MGCNHLTFITRIYNKINEGEAEDRAWSSITLMLKAKSVSMREAAQPLHAQATYKCIVFNRK